VKNFISQSRSPDLNEARPRFAGVVENMPINPGLRYQATVSDVPEEEGPAAPEKTERLFSKGPKADEIFNKLKEGLIAGGTFWMVARELNVKPSALYTFFRKRVGMTLQQWLKATATPEERQNRKEKVPNGFRR